MPVSILILLFFLYKCVGILTAKVVYVILNGLRFQVLGSEELATNVLSLKGLSKTALGPKALSPK